MHLLRLIAPLVLLTAAAAAHALDVKPYSDAALVEAQRADRPVALHFHADWCPTCRAQSKVLQTLQAQPGLDVTVLTVDYDNAKAIRRQHGVQAQSTLVVLRGGREQARLVGETSEAGIRNALKSAL